MPNYFVEENIVENCLHNLNGDCGVYASTFVTLCRCAGIPAQWQSGLSAEPGYCSPHDWARFYIAPYGWLYADCSFGGGAVRANNEERRKHFFGNLDGFRIVTTNAFQQEFDIPKKHWRADPYDNQQGEIESADRGFDYDEFTQVRKTLDCEPLD
ncbi:MAG: transglutaminase domain-containing protein, partial [Oscillospiraceae bacterium]|nr:transglutaminase domain-containing protein [Oscillospiraceae bacterium]